MDLVAHFRNVHKTLHFPAASVIFREGDRADVMYILLDGLIDVTINGSRVELAEPGSILGEMALIDGSARSATLVTRTPCLVTVVDVQEFDRLIRETPEFARHVMAILAKRLREMNRRMQPPGESTAG